MTSLVIILGRGTFRGVASQEAAVNLVGIGPGDPDKSDTGSTEHPERLAEDLRGR